LGDLNTIGSDAVLVSSRTTQKMCGKEKIEQAKRKTDTDCGKHKKGTSNEHFGHHSFRVSVGTNTLEPTPI
jgi:hypothetical protein